MVTWLNIPGSVYSNILGLTVASSELVSSHITYDNPTQRNRVLVRGKVQKGVQTYKFSLKILYTIL